MTNNRLEHHSRTRRSGTVQLLLPRMRRHLADADHIGEHGGASDVSGLHLVLRCGRVRGSALGRAVSEPWRSGAGVELAVPERRPAQAAHAEIALQYTGRVPLPYSQPAWNALLFSPLSLLPFRIAHALWIAILAACVFAVAVMAGGTYTLCAARPAAPSRMEGLIALAVGLSPLAYRAIRVGNPSAVVGACLGFAAIQLLHRDGCAQRWQSGLALCSSTPLSCSCPWLCSHGAAGHFSERPRSVRRRWQ